MHGQNFDAGVKMNAVSIETSSFSVKFSIEILIGEITPVVTEKRGFENQDVLIIEAIIGFFGLSDFDAVIKKNDFPMDISLISK